MEEKKSSRAPVFFIIIFVLVLAALYAYLYLLPGISESRSKTEVVYYATVQEYTENRCIAVRKEKVYKAGIDGSVSYYSKEGEKTRQGTMIADVYAMGNRESVVAETTGTVSFFIDGYEEYFDSEHFDALDPDELSEMEDIVPKSSEKSEAASDDVIFKLITSDVWHMIIIEKKDQSNKLKTGQSIIIEVDDGTRIPAVVSAVKEGEKNDIVLTDISMYYEKSLQIRTIQAKIISSEKSGLMVPTSAVTTNGENIGVYILGTDGNYSFRAIEIITQTGDNTLIAEDGYVRLYDEVLKNAKNYKR